MTSGLDEHGSGVVRGSAAEVKMRTAMAKLEKLGWKMPDGDALDACYGRSDAQRRALLSPWLLPKHRRLPTSVAGKAVTVETLQDHAWHTAGLPPSIVEGSLGYVRPAAALEKEVETFVRAMGATVVTLKAHAEHMAGLARGRPIMTDAEYECGRTFVAMQKAVADFEAAWTVAVKNAAPAKRGGGGNPTTHDQRAVNNTVMNLVEAGGLKLTPGHCVLVVDAFGFEDNSAKGHPSSKWKEAIKARRHQSKRGG